MLLHTDPEHGIFGATPVEIRHAFRKGAIEKVTNWFWRVF
jgi:hypothetical protein